MFEYSTAAAIKWDKAWENCLDPSGVHNPARLSFTLSWVVLASITFLLGGKSMDLVSCGAPTYVSVHMCIVQYRCYYWDSWFTETCQFQGFVFLYINSKLAVLISF